MNNRIIPPTLKPGDKIAIVATARKISREELQPSIDIFSSWGLKVVVDDELFSTDNQFAGGDKTRAALLQKYINDPSINAIISARGGYGTVRIIDSLDFSSLDSNPKWIIGYSDITVLHSHIHKHTNIATLHAPMPINMQPHNIDVDSINSLRQVLMADESPSHNIITPHYLNRAGVMRGEIVGGNLSVLYSLLGSPSDIDTQGKILFLEDLDEYLYHVDRMMQALKRSGKLSKLTGLIVGGMSDMKDNLVPFGYTAEQIVFNTVQEFKYPLLFGFPAGHDPVNFPVRFGINTEYTVC